MVAPVPIVAATITGLGTLLSAVTLRSNLKRENEKLASDLAGALSTLMRRMHIVQWNFICYEGSEEHMGLLIHDLLFDIDDFVRDLSVSGTLAEMLKPTVVRDKRPHEIKQLEHFISEVDAIISWQKEQIKDRKDKLPEDGHETVPPYAQKQDLDKEKDLDGVFQAQKSKLLELLSPVKGGHLRCISIVGFKGLGKSCLTRVFYEEAVIKESRVTNSTDRTYYNVKIWVDASTCDTAKDLRGAIMNKIARLTDTSSSSMQTVLSDQRYLLVIDDLRSKCVQWEDIKDLFPDDSKDSRIIVTTVFNSVARKYSSGRYYVLPLDFLDETRSEDLFWRKVRGRKPWTRSAPEEERANAILAKCNGLPIAILRSGEYVCSKGNNPVLTEDIEKEVCTELSNIATSDVAVFSDIKKLYAQCYRRLKDHDHMLTLCYFSMYPQGHEVNRNRFARRLQSEGLLMEEDVSNCLTEFMDESLIRGTGKTCQVQGLLLDFATNKFLASNFVTYVEEGNVRPSIRRSNFAVSQMISQLRPKSRRLAVQCGTRTSQCVIPHDVTTKTVRSLIIFRSKDPSAVTRVDGIEFKSFKVMQVLDLEGCTGLGKCTGVLIAICDLVYLKHLNLRSTDVDLIPAKIQNLIHLELLDLRLTIVDRMPVEVLMLPELTHLFGKFVLPDLQGKTQIITFLKEKSKLITVHGIVIKKHSAFDTLISLARSLEKVKIYGVTTPASRPFLKVACVTQPSVLEEDDFRYDDTLVHDPWVKDPLVRRVAKSLVSVGMRPEGLGFTSISIDSGGISRAFLGCLSTGFTVKQIKLRGPLTALPFHGVGIIRRMYLNSSGLSNTYLAQALQELRWLEYLKLVEKDHDGSWAGVFSVKGGGFPALRELCFKGGINHPSIKIQPGGMDSLSALEVLCPHSTAAENGGSLIKVEGIEFLWRLDKLAFLHTANVAIVRVLQDIAKNHSNRPCVMIGNRQI